MPVSVLGRIATICPLKLLLLLWIYSRLVWEGKSGEEGKEKSNVIPFTEAGVVDDMRQVVVRKYGDPALEGTLEVMEGLGTSLAADMVAAGFVRVRVAAVSLNYADLLQAKGTYQERRAVPFVAGSEMAGVVDRTGEGVTNVRVGDRVCGLAVNGALAELIDVPAAAVFPVETNVSMEQAACACVALGTGWMALVQRAKIHSGSRVLILGGAGGIGSSAIQICAALGVETVATATSDSKAAFARRLGASDVIRLTRSSPGSGKDDKLLQQQFKPYRGSFDVILDSVGGKALNAAALQSLCWGGQFCIVGFASGELPPLPANILLVKNLTVHGIYWGGHLTHPGHRQQLVESVDAAMALLHAKRVSIPIAHVFRLEDTRKAYQTLQKGQDVFGKVVVRVTNPPRASI